MAENSVFAILLRSAWWISLAVAVAIVAASRALLPERFVWFGVFSAIPFLVISVIAASRQLRQPSPTRQAARIDGLRAMAWPEFAELLAAGYAREGGRVERLAGPVADLRVERSGRVSLVGARRWKAARVGVEPLRELQQLRQSLQADEGVYVATGEPSAAALAYAAEHGLRLLAGAELVRLIGIGPPTPAAKAGGR